MVQVTFTFLKSLISVHEEDYVCTSVLQVKYKRRDL